MIPRLGGWRVLWRVREALTCYLNQVCSGHVLGVGAEAESQRWTQDTVKKQKPTAIETAYQSWKSNHSESGDEPGRHNERGGGRVSSGAGGPTRVTCDNLMSRLKTAICILMAFIY